MGKRNKSKEKTKRKILIFVIILMVIMIIAEIININIKSSKTKKTASQAINEQEHEMPDIDLNLTDQNVANEDETEPLDENAIDENVLNESKVTDEKQIKENTNKYYIKVNNQANVVTIYTKDSNGDYTVPIKAMVCSTGTATPTGGKYKMTGVKHTFHTLFGHTPGTYVYGQYSTSIVGNILFHSVPYTVKGNPSSLEYWEYDKLGTKASAGCIRLTVRDAKWIYDNVPAGTIVEFYYSSNPGPLGKPFAQKISGNVQCRNWDPTDPDKRNLWLTYDSQAEAKKEAEHKAEADRRAREENENKAKAQQEAEQQAEKERKAREEAERRAKEETEKQRRQEQEKANRIKEQEKTNKTKNTENTDSSQNNTNSKSNITNAESKHNTEIMSTNKIKTTNNTNF